MRHTKSTGHVSANVPTDLKKWLRQRAYEREILITDMINEALQDYRRKIEKRGK